MKPQVGPAREGDGMDYKKLKDLPIPYGKKAKEKLDNWINENVNVPFAEEGYENAGAALSAALSTAGEVLIPEDMADVAMSAIPGAKLFKSATKGMKVLKKAGPAIDYKNIKMLEDAKASATKSINYDEIAKAEKAKAMASREAADKAANTIKYDKKGKVSIEGPKKDKIPKTQGTDDYLEFVED